MSGGSNYGVPGKTPLKPGQLGYVKPAPKAKPAAVKAKTPGQLMKKLKDFEWDFEAMGRA